MKKLIALVVPALAGLALLGGGRSSPPSTVTLSAAPAAAVSQAAAPASQPAPEAPAAPEAAPAAAPSEPAASAAAPAPHAAPAAAIDTASSEEASPADEPAAPASEYCPKDGSVYLAGSCVLDPSVVPSGAAEGTPVKYCSANWECPADYPDSGDGQPLTDCTTTDYHSCESYQPKP